MNSHRSCEQFGPGWQTAAYMRTTRGGVWQEASAFDETVELLQQQPLVHDTSLSTLESTSTVNELHDDEGPKRKKPRYDGSNPEKDAQEILKLLVGGFSERSGHENWIKVLVDTFGCKGHLGGGMGGGGQVF
ncbi:hypothetical protein L596_012728 [Steinernema carpocapsae]|uniref:Uncharacterized protein n=1 Tax=Steinernema carpocapsae TaxID=34508 RepID=A0A4U5NY52_STECR|nr:hypothetical protein L596_012728 [Steinernema carpocapsae]